MYTYYRRTPEGWPTTTTDQFFIAVEDRKQRDVLDDLGWERVLYRQLTQWLTDTEIRTIKYGDPGIEYRKGISNGIYGFEPSGRTIDTLIDEWADMMERLDAQQQRRSWAQANTRSIRLADGNFRRIGFWDGMLMVLYMSNGVEWWLPHDLPDAENATDDELRAAIEEANEVARQAWSK